MKDLKSAVNLNIEGEEKKILKYLWQAECLNLASSLADILCLWPIFLIEKSRK
jgi:hypothetical protein